MNTFDLTAIRSAFPGLNQTLYGTRRLVYLDNAATTQKPQPVLDILSEHALYKNANIHRGVHYLSQVATAAHEEARQRVARFIGAEAPEEVLFTRGTTEGINLVATVFCSQELKPGDVVLVSEMEHHSNIVPWQIETAKVGAKVESTPILDNGELDLMSLQKRLKEGKVKLLSICYSSNVLGTVNPIKEIVDMAHREGVTVMVDAAQGVAHRAIDVSELDCDFLAFSGHKVYAPTGIGILYGKKRWLEKLPPYQGGGEMIQQVSFRGTTYADLPYKYEAGTPDFLGSVALAKALDFVESVGFEQIQSHEAELLRYATGRLLSEFPTARIYGTAPEKEAVLSFLIDNVHPYDLGTLLDQQGIALRTGHHCAQPLMQRLGIDGTLRASFALYNTKDEIDLFFTALHKALPLLL